MKPLLPNKAKELLTRIDNAIDGEIYAVTMNNPQNFTIELSVQDKNRGYDWINIAFEIDGVSDARLIEDEKLSLVSLDEGISLLSENGSIGIAIGHFTTLSTLKDAVVYLVGSSVKYEERNFSS